MKPEVLGLGITVVTPSVPPRAGMLADAMASVSAQTLAPVAHVVVVDHEGNGEAATRNRGLFAVDTEWTAFLDDDDVLYPHHLSALTRHQEMTDADLCYGWFDVQGGTDPLGWFGKDFDPDALRENNYIPVTYLVRTELAQGVGGFPAPEGGYPSQTACVDWAFLLRLLDVGARFEHLAERTWCWRHHGGNYSGRVWNNLERHSRQATVDPVGNHGS